MGDARELVAIQRVLHGCDRRRPVGAVDDELRDHGIVEHGNFGALVHPGIDAAGRARLGLAIAREAPDGGHEAPRRVLGIDAALHRPAVPRHVLLAERDWLAGGDPDLLLHQIDAGHHLRYGMFNLEPRVHLQEVEVPLLVGDELHCAGGAIAHGLRQCASLGAHGRPRRLVEQRARCLLDYLLVAALDRAFPLAEVDDRAGVIGKHLNLDMARVHDEALDEDPPVAEGRHRLVDGGRHALAQPGLVPDQPHALAAAAGRRLEHDRIADFACRGDRRLGVVDRVLRAWNSRNTGVGGDPAGGELVPHRRDGACRRADEGDSRLGQRLGEGRALGEEAIAGMYGLRAGLGNRGQEGLDIQIALGGGGGADDNRLVRHAHVQRAVVGLRIDRDGADAQAPRGANHPAGDLSAIGDQDLGKHRRLSCPRGGCSRASSTGSPGAWCAASRRRAPRGRGCPAGGSRRR